VRIRIFIAGIPCQSGIVLAEHIKQTEDRQRNFWPLYCSPAPALFPLAIKFRSTTTSDSIAVFRLGSMSGAKNGEWFDGS
jgi:hypothetical protein